MTANHVAEEAYGTVPHSFVFHRGQIGKNVGQLVLDMRQVMRPYTAESLKVCVFSSYLALPLGIGGVFLGLIGKSLNWLIINHTLGFSYF